MRVKRIASLLLLTLFATAMLGGLSQTASAQSATGEEEVGIGQVFSSAKYDDEKAAKPWQIWLAVGSIPVMLIVVKYL